jgi:hypothetical protein
MKLFIGQVAYSYNYSHSEMSSRRCGLTRLSSLTFSFLMAIHSSTAILGGVCLLLVLGSAGYSVPSSAPFSDLFSVELTCSVFCLVCYIPQSNGLEDTFLKGIHCSGNCSSSGFQSRGNVCQCTCCNTRLQLPPRE